MGWTGTFLHGHGPQRAEVLGAPSHQFLHVFPFSSLHEETLHTARTSMQTHNWVSRQTAALHSPHNSGQSIWELFQDPGMLQSSHSMHRSLIVQQSVLITHTVYVQEGLIGFMPLWWIHFPLKDDTQAYITCLIKNKILQPTICSFPWAHATYIMMLPLSQLIAYSPTSLSLYIAAYGLGR